MTEKSIRGDVCKHNCGVCGVVGGLCYGPNCSPAREEQNEPTLASLRRILAELYSGQGCIQQS